MTDYPESFANFPQSVGDVRSERTMRAKDWTPREALIDVLRLIDSGEFAPDTLIVAMSGPGLSGGVRVRFRVSSPSPVSTLGTLEMVKREVVE